MQESSISEKIKELRTDLKMNQKNFSAAIGIRQSTLSSYENDVVTPSNDVLLTGKLNEHLNQTDQEAREQVETLMEQMTEKQGVTEELKAQDQMERVRLMNNIKASAEEIVLKNMIYV